MKNNELYKAGLYCRLSKDDDQAGESVSIGTQRAILADYCAEKNSRSTNSTSMTASQG